MKQNWRLEFFNKILGVERSGRLYTFGIYGEIPTNGCVCVRVYGLQIRCFDRRGMDVARLEDLTILLNTVHSHVIRDEALNV